MTQFILFRLFYGLIVLVLVTLIVSSIVYLAPVDPARLTFGQRMDDATVKDKRVQLGLDLPLRDQMILYLKDISPILITAKSNWKSEYKGNFISLGDQLIFGWKMPYLRESFQSGRPVSEILSTSFVTTAILALSAIGLAIVLGLLLGALAALNRGSWIDQAIIFCSTLGYSVPSYVAAMILGIVFGFYLKEYTGLNIQGSLWEYDNHGNRVLSLSNLILPAIALGIRPVSIIAQLMRSSMLDVVQQKYIMTARAKGLTQFDVIRRHIFKNALNPVVTALSGWFAALLAGAFFVEVIFNFKGLGFVTVHALLNYDIPVILGALLMTCCIFVLINILVDISYKLLDPRVQLKH